MPTSAIGPIRPASPPVQDPQPDPPRGTFAHAFAEAAQRAESGRAVERVARLQPLSPMLAICGQFMGVVHDLQTGGAAVDKLIDAAASGKTFSNAELIGLQAQMYRYSTEVELLSKIVQQGVEGLRQLLKMNV